MDRQQILDLYDWAPGICFRHPAEGEQPTVHVQTVRPATGGIQDVRACPCCVLAMEREKEEAASRRGDSYSPGLLGDSPDR